MANTITWTTGAADTQKKVAFHIGDTVRVHYKLIEHEKVAGKTKREVHEETRERTQVFEGIVISIKGSSANVMFTVRKVAVGAIGVERIFPLLSPWIKKIEVKDRGNVRRAKLYYLRAKSAREVASVHEATSPTPAAG